jgi:hypothetical protein
MTNSFIVFAISLSGGFAALLTLGVLNTVLRHYDQRKPKLVQVVYSARYEHGLWNVYYDDSTLDEPIRIACFADVRDAEHLLTRVEQHAVQTDTAVPTFDEPCEGRR